MLSVEKVRKVLLLYDEKVIFIGDSCQKFSRLRFVKRFFHDALVDFNTQPENCARVFQALLKGNPYINKFSNVKWPEIDFLDYDVVITVSHEEAALLRLFEERYGAPEYETRKPLLLSLSRLILHPAHPFGESGIPEYKELQDFVISCEEEVRPELHILPEEKEWGNSWLRDNGLGRTNRLYIMVDSTTIQDKLLTEDVHFEVVTELLKQKRTKLLIFDEGSIGKQEWYTSRLGRAQTRKIIFCRGLGLREALCIIGADATKLIFGPCSGLLHCASGIYNVLKQNPASRRQPPLMITYTGIYKNPGESAQLWWGKSPLVHCLLLRDYGNGKKINLLGEVGQEEKTDLTHALPCSEYTAPLLIGALRKLGGIK